MNRLRQFAFPLSLAVILGALSAWLGQVSQISIEEVPLNPKEPQYLIAQAAAKRYDSTGSLQQQLVSPKAWQLPDQKKRLFRTARPAHLDTGTLQIPRYGTTGTV